MESSAEVLTIGSPDSLPIVGTSTDNFKRLSVLINKKYMTTRFTRIVQFLILAGLIFVTALLIMLNGAYKVSASAPSGLQGTVATSSVSGVGTTVVTLIATTTGSCSARIISTKTSAIMLTFSDYAGQAPTGTFGHVQPASTTVAYDSGLYGCGLVKAFGFAADTVTITEVR